MPVCLSSYEIELYKGSLVRLRSAFDFEDFFLIFFPHFFSFFFQLDREGYKSTNC
jgi:hypothetical protein